MTINSAPIDLKTEACDELRADLAWRKQQHIEESKLKGLLQAYIENAGKTYAYGGIVNLLGTIANIMRDMSQLEGDDYEKADELIRDCSAAVDLKYSEPEHPFSGSCGGD